MIMAGVSSTETFGTLATRFEATVAELKAHGVRISNTRIDRYRRHLQDLIAQSESGALQADWLKLPADERVTRTVKALSTLYELSEIDALSRDWNPAQRVELFDALRKVASGPDGYADERPGSTFPRDSLFELQTARVFAAAGLTFAHLPPADLAIYVAGRPVVIECKRPQTEAGILRKLREGFKQVRKRVTEQRGFRVQGIVALDLSKAINPSFDQLHIEKESIGMLVTRIVDEAADMIANELRPGEHHRTLAVFLRFSVIGIDHDKVRPVYGQQHALLSLPQTRPSDAALRDSIGLRLNALGETGG
jgi:hypothetical protein